MRGDVHNVLLKMGFEPIEPGSNFYTNLNLGSKEFDFSSSQAIDYIPAVIWNAGASLGREEAIRIVQKNMFQGI